MAIIASAVPLILVRGVAQELEGRDVRVELSFYSVALVALSLTIMLVLLQRSRSLRAELYRSRRRLTTLESELLSKVEDGRTDGGPQSVVFDEPTEPVDEKIPVPAATDGGSAQPPVTVIVHSADGSGDKGKWSPGTIVLLLVALISGVFGIAQAVVSQDTAPIDCIGYSRRLQELDDRYSPAELDRALVGFSFGRYDQACGDARSYFRRLHTMPSVGSR